MAGARAARVAQADITRMIRALRAAGEDRFTVETLPDGTIRANLGGPEGGRVTRNPLDRVLEP
jgi:phospholipase/lecithinase/hemolysin